MNLPSSSEKQSKLLASIYGYFKKHLVLNPAIRTNSNVEFKELVRLMSCCGVALVDDPSCQYKNRLNKFLSYRNGIAHGNNGIVVGDELIREFADLIAELMNVILNMLDDSLKNRKYLENSLTDIS